MQRLPRVELAGFLESAVGAGEAARRYLGALRSVGVPVRPRDVELPGRDPARTALDRAAASPCARRASTLSASTRSS